MSWYFLHGLKMIITAVGIMPLTAKKKKKEPEEKSLVLITGDFCYFSYQTFSKLSNLK